LIPCWLLLLLQAFDDCTTLSSTFKLLESFEGLLERDAIAAELAKKHKDMVAAFASDVKEVHELFLANRAFPVLSKNSPPHSGVTGCSYQQLNCTTAPAPACT
jgi:dynein heavy chain